MKRALSLMLVSFLSLGLLTGFGLKDLKKEIGPKTEKCEGKKNESKCKNKERLKSAGKVVAISVAAKLLTDMIIEYKSKKTASGDTVKARYLKEHKKLPKEPKVVAYSTSISPDGIAQGGKKISVSSKFEVVPSKKSDKVRIEEKIEIYDNEDNSKLVKSLVKPLNDPDLDIGQYDNQFTFSLPKGMPEGVYPIKTSVLLDGKAQPAKSQKMQVVLNILKDGSMNLAYLDTATVPAL